MKLDWPTAVLVVFLPLIGCSTAAVPPSVEIIAPDARLPASVRAFSGKWAGRWDGELDHFLIVEEIESRHAIAVYSWGTSLRWGTKPDWRRARGPIEPGVLKLTLGDRVWNQPVEVTYRLRGDDTLEATWERAGRLSRAVLRRAD
jgi:hypothetical protein